MIVMERKRSGGVLMPVFSLPNGFSCGSFGKEAFAFIDFLTESGFSVWQVLPFNVPDGSFSPYSSFSAFGGNPFFIDLFSLVEEGLLTQSEVEAEKQAVAFSCEYDRLAENRMPLLKKAALRVKDYSPIDAFFAENPRLMEFCLFMAQKEANGGKEWRRWTEPPDREALLAWRFSQFTFFRQWERVHGYARKKGISILGDLPFYVAKDSADVKNSPHLFQLDEKGEPKSVAGVPPDAFSPEGQKWGNPLYDWKEMKKDGYSWWKERTAFWLSYFDGVRIDHFRAVSSYWSIPAGEETAKGGHWEKGPGMGLLKALGEVTGGKTVIAENLGTLDEESEKLLQKSGYPGMAVLQFGFDGGSDNPHLPHNYRENLVAYSGTHDNNTFLGFLWECGETTRNALFAYLGQGKEEEWDSAREKAIRFLLMSRAETVILPIQDLCGFGGDTRFNTPGKVGGNWSFRVTAEQMDSLDRSRWLSLNRLYGRK